MKDRKVSKSKSVSRSRSPVARRYAVIEALLSSPGVYQCLRVCVFVSVCLCCLCCMCACVRLCVVALCVACVFVLHIILLYVGVQGKIAVPFSLSSAPQVREPHCFCVCCFVCVRFASSHVCVRVCAHRARSPSKSKSPSRSRSR